LYAFTKCAAIRWLSAEFECGLRGSAASSVSAVFAVSYASFAVSIAVWTLETNNMGLKTGHERI
jgi:hypothetical protein